jgi:hypothetical protein
MNTRQKACRIVCPSKDKADRNACRGRNGQCRNAQKIQQGLDRDAIERKQGKTSVSGADPYGDKGSTANGQDGRKTGD